ncbi:unnamed protein product [Closterium sp. Yama58-4]|nr:unnamed protein product [Closterium sp. Yama58-4]
MTSSAIGKCTSDVSGSLLRAKLLPWAAAALFSATSRAFSAASSSAGRCAQAGGGAGEGAGGAAEGSGGGGNLAAIKELRARTGAPVKDVKAALVAAGWDLDAAFTELRRRGLAAAQKKRARVAAEGLVGVAVRRGVGAVAVEVNSETDFVARNDLFQLLVSKAAAAALSLSPSSSSSSSPSSLPLPLPLANLEQATVSFDHPKLSGSRQLADAVAEVAALTGENVRLRRAFLLPEPRPFGSVATYLHSSPGAGLGRIAGLVREDVPGEVVERESDVLRAQAVAAGKPASVVEKMVAGRLGKFYGEVVLLEQAYALDDKRTVQKVVAEASKKAGATIQVEQILRLEVGEGIEREAKDFASEVASQVASSS